MLPTLTIKNSSRLFGKITTLVGLVADKILSVDEAAKRAGMAKKDFLKYLN